ncbi:type II toxin-antitoxin system RelE/ParE family toxin [Sulfurimonas lithotrophica]|nr:type II toxin-antitoxin system RelE/ParE family toxin [Sulfurimonas lithotrophica]
MENKIIDVNFYKTDSGNEPVREWLKSMDIEDRKVIGEDIKTAEFGWPVGMPLIKKIDSKYKLWEVRTNLNGNRIARVIFTIYKDCMILLHGFIKKSQKLPQKDKELAIERSKKFNKGDCDEK